MTPGQAFLLSASSLFTDAARPEISEPLYELVVEECQKRGFDVGTGVFGADMKVESINDGPVTILLDSCDFSGKK